MNENPQSISEFDRALGLLKAGYALNVAQIAVIKGLSPIGVRKRLARRGIEPVPGSSPMIWAAADIEREFFGVQS